jgi:hypothetical protein
LVPVERRPALGRLGRVLRALVDATLVPREHTTTCDESRRDAENRRWTARSLR